MKLKWSKYLFANIKRQRKFKIIGHNIFATGRFNGKFVIWNGICISLKSSKQFLLTSSLSLRKTGDENFFINFPIYLAGVLNFNIVGLTYNYKINCSKLVSTRFKE